MKQYRSLHPLPKQSILGAYLTSPPRTYPQDSCARGSFKKLETAGTRAAYL